MDNTAPEGNPYFKNTSTVAGRLEFLANGDTYRCQYDGGTRVWKVYVLDGPDFRFAYNVELPETATCRQIFDDLDLQDSKVLIFC
jgi:hypothetical protein